MNCEIINVGTELLLGDILNTNSQYLSQALAGLGIGVYYQTSVGDNHERLRDLIMLALSRSDLLILTGGLGPTVDDITKKCSAECFNVPLIRNPELENNIREFFKNKNFEMSENNLLQADMPENCTVFENTCGTAPGAALEKDGKIIILLPGPPREMTAMFEKSVRPFLQSRSSSVILSHNLRLFGIGESKVDSILNHFFNMENPTVAPYAKDSEVLIRITAKSGSTENAENLIAPVIEDIKKIVGEYIYGIDVSGIEEALVKALSESGRTVSTAESCTGGMIAQRITSVPGASDVFSLGIVSYSIEQKINILGVDPEIIKKHGVYSSQTAAEMADRIRIISKSDFGIATTGVAGPSDDGNTRAGTVFIAVSTKNGVKTEKIERPMSSREQVRIFASNSVMNLCLKGVNQCHH